MLTIVLTSLAVSFVGTPILRKFAFRMGWIDHPTGGRKIHNVPIVNIGGVMLFFAFFVAVVLNVHVGQTMQGVLLCAFLITAIGFLDDWISLKPSVKLLGQILVAFLTTQFGVEVSVISNPFTGGSFPLGIWSVPITIFWIVAVMNTVNLIDGLDGLAAGIAAISATFISVVAIHTGQYQAAVLTLAVLGACLGFLRYNFSPAQIFMGDSGSLFLGYILATASIIGVLKSPISISLAVPILVLGLPISDTAFAIIRRLRAGRAIFGADRSHIHHQLLDKGLSSKQAVKFCYLLTFGLGLMGLGLSVARGMIAWWVLGLILAILFTFYAMAKSNSEKFKHWIQHWL